MSGIKLNVPYKCTFCKKDFVVIRGRGWYNSYLPVDVINGTEVLDMQFDKEKHKSHLISCPELQKIWSEIQARIGLSEAKKDKMSVK